MPIYDQILHLQGQNEHISIILTTKDMLMWIDEIAIDAVAYVIHLFFVVLSAAQNIIGGVKCAVKGMLALLLKIRISLHIIYRGLR